MKRLYATILVVCGLLCGFGSYAQQTATSLSTGFAAGDPNPSFASILAGSFTFTVVNEELKIDYNREQWYFIQNWIGDAPGIDLRPNPYVRFKIKSDKPTTLTVVIKYDDTENASKSVQLIGGDNWQNVFLDFSEQISVFNHPIKEVQLSLPYVTSGKEQGVLIIDDYKLGDAAAPISRPPTINSIAAITIPVDAGLQTVNLNGITDGGEGDQNLTVTATSSAPEFIPNPTVSYTSPNAMGVLKFTPAAGQIGTATITVTVKDSGTDKNTYQTTFLVVVAEMGGSAFADDFNDGVLYLGWQTSSDYSFSEAGGNMKVAVGKNDKWEGFVLDLGKAFDFSSAPFVNIRIKGDKEFVLHVYFVDGEDKNAMQTARVFATDDFTTVSFDFTGATDINLSAITKMIFAVNGEALTFDGNLFIDDLKVGMLAERKANFAAINNQTYYVNSGQKSILVKDITNTTALNVSGGEPLVENLKVTTITDGKATITFNLKKDAIGEAVITVKTESAFGFAQNTSTFKINVTGNIVPSMVQPADMIAEKSVLTTINLTGIDDGNENADQKITVRARSSNNAIILNLIPVDYVTGSRYASIELTPVGTGKATITVTLIDNGESPNNVSEKQFEVEVFESLNNPPSVEPLEDISILNNVGEQVIELTGIDDGDTGVNQKLIITATSSDNSIVAEPVVVYTDGNTAQLKFTPNATTIGTSTITVTVADEGGTAQNNGNKSTVFAFKITTRVPPLTGWVVPLNSVSEFGPEGNGVQYFLSIIDTAGSKALKIRMQDKWTYGGIWMDSPELDLTNYPYISFEVYSLDKPSWHWNYFYDAADGDAAVTRNIENSGTHTYEAPANQWTKLSFDYSDNGDMNNSKGQPIKAEHIIATLFNMHGSAPSWPFTNFTGTVYFRNIRIGSEAEIPAKTPTCTINGVSEQGSVMQSGEQTVKLTGISNGKKETTGITIKATSSNTTYATTPILSAVDENGNATLKYTVGNKPGSAVITVTVEATGSYKATMSFKVTVISNSPAGIAQVTIDRKTKYQTIRGLGTFENEERWTDLYATDLGASAVRMGLIGNQIEPVNDNDDPNVLNLAGYDYSAVNWNYVRKMKEAGVETFILTSWSPPAWMKRNFSMDYMMAQAIEWENTINILEPDKYEEYAESMVALVKMYKQEAGVDLYAIGLQNEPYFNEPYPSAILGPKQFNELIKIVGHRFENEGIKTKFFMPEQVVGIGGWSGYDNSNYFDAVQADAEVNRLTDIFAVHGYGSDGITAGFPDYAAWNTLWTNAQEGSNPKELWMSETHIAYNGWAAAIQTAGAIHGSLFAGNISLWTNWSFGDMQLTKNIPNSTFYTSKNYFKHIRPGAVRVKTTTSNGDIMVTAFEDADEKSFTVVMINKGANPVNVKISGMDLPEQYKSFRTSEFENFVEVTPVTGEVFLLPASSVTTLYSDALQVLTIDDIPNQTVNEDSPKQTLNLAGISSLSGATTGLQLAVTTDKPELFSLLEASQIQTNGIATLNYTPATSKTGVAQITLTLTDNSGNSTQKVFSITIAPKTNIRDEVANILTLYPNPAKGFVTVSIPNDFCNSIEMHDISGKLVKSLVIKGNQQSVYVSLDGLESGIYFVTIKGRQKEWQAKLVVN